MTHRTPISVTLPAIAALIIWPASLGGCRRVEPSPIVRTGTLALVYSANVMGEIEPCG